MACLHEAQADCSAFECMQAKGGSLLSPTTIAIVVGGLVVLGGLLYIGQTV